MHELHEHEWTKAQHGPRGWESRLQKVKINKVQVEVLAARLPVGSGVLVRASRQDKMELEAKESTDD